MRDLHAEPIQEDPWRLGEDARAQFFEFAETAWPTGHRRLAFHLVWRYPRGARHCPAMQLLYRRRDAGDGQAVIFLV